MGNDIIGIRTARTSTSVRVTTFTDRNDDGGDVRVECLGQTVWIAALTDAETGMVFGYSLRGDRYSDRERAVQAAVKQMVLSSPEKLEVFLMELEDPSGSALRHSALSDSLAMFASSQY